MLTDIGTASEGNAPPSPPTASAAKAEMAAEPDGIISEAAAQEIFDELKNNDEFFWEHIEDCCLARAHKMCSIFKAKGIYSEKIRADNPEGTWMSSFGLAAPDKRAPGKYLCFNFHVAAVIQVKIPNGVEERVIDPALFDPPVTQQVWSDNLINRHSIRPDGTIDQSLQKKEYRRMACDVFDIILFWTRKDDDLAITNKLLARHGKKCEGKK